MTIPDILATHSLSQAALHRLTGIPVRTIQDWVAGKRRPPAWLPPILDTYLTAIGHPSQ